MRVKELAHLVGVPPDTVRFYTREGLLSPNKNPANGYREYGPSDVKRLGFILRARQLAFSVEDIRTLLTQADRGEAPCPTARALIEARLAEMEQRLEELQKLCKRMRAATQTWEAEPDCEPCDQHICHLIELFDDREAKQPLEEQGLPLQAQERSHV